MYGFARPLPPDRRLWERAEAGDRQTLFREFSAAAGRTGPKTGYIPWRYSLSPLQERGLRRIGPRSGSSSGKTSAATHVRHQSGRGLYAAAGYTKSITSKAPPRSESGRVRPRGVEGPPRRHRQTTCDRCLYVLKRQASLATSWAMCHDPMATNHDRTVGRRRGLGGYWLMTL